MTARTVWSERWRGAVLPVFVLLLWSAATCDGWVSTDVLVTPWRMLAPLGDASIRSDLIAGISASAVRFSEGALLGITLGLGLGVALGLSRPTDRAIGPSFHAVRQIAIFAWVPLLTAWFGNGDLGKVVFIALGAFYPVVMGTYEGIRGVPLHLREIGQLYCFGPWRLLRRIVLPAAVPAIVAALQLAIIFSWLATIGAEYLMGGASRGIGTFVMGGREQLRTDIVLLGVTVIAASGFLLNTLLRAGSRRLLRWRDATS